MWLDRWRYLHICPHACSMSISRLFFALFISLLILIISQTKEHPKPHHILRSGCPRTLITETRIPPTIRWEEATVGLGLLRERNRAVGNSYLTFRRENLGTVITIPVGVTIITLYSPQILNIIRWHGAPSFSRNRSSIFIIRSSRRNGPSISVY